MKIDRAYIRRVMLRAELPLVYVCVCGVCVYTTSVGESRAADVPKSVNERLLTFSRKCLSKLTGKEPLP